MTSARLGSVKAIVAACKNGLLIDALDADGMAAALLDRIVPLADGNHSEVANYEVVQSGSTASLQIHLNNGSVTGLADAGVKFDPLELPQDREVVPRRYPVSGDIVGRETVVADDDAGAADEMFRLLMGDKVEPRREFIQNHALEVTELDI